MREFAREVGVNVLAAIALAGLAFVAFGGRMDDLYLRTRGAGAASGEVAIVAIDEEALYLWGAASPELTPRELLATLVRFCHTAGARVVVLDVLTDTSAPGDDALIDAARAHGRVVAAERFVPGFDATPFAAGSVLGDAGVAAYANLGMEERTWFSGDMLVREVPLVHSVARARMAGSWPQNLVGAWQDDESPMPALALAAAWLQRDGGDLAATLAARCGGSPVACTSTLAELGLPPSPVPLHAPLPVNFRVADGIPTIPAARILRAMGEDALARSLGLDLPFVPPADLARTLSGRVALIGRVDAGAADTFVTPLSVFDDMNGVRIHAQLVDALLSGRHLRRVDGAPAWAAAVALAGAVVWTRRWSPARHLALWALVTSALVVGGISVFRATDGLALDVGPSVLALWIAWIGVRAR